ncbi:MAG: Uma2 family endonuclease [Chloroflexi bacterium]|nr:Uma2 family endonuclease [Chloroflexota bacterium]
MPLATVAPAPIEYPDSDGQPMADNTKQWEWMVSIKNGFEAMYKDDPNVFVAGDLLWYSQQGRPDLRLAPDIMLAFGRPKGYRGSYKQWEENDIAPQVVFEILSPGNRAAEMRNKLRFYNRYEVEEYYVYDPDTGDLEGYVRKDDVFQSLHIVPDMQGFISPRTGVKFHIDGVDLVLTKPDDTRFETYLELLARAEIERNRAETERNRAETEHNRAETERNRAETEHNRAETERNRAETERNRAETERNRAETERNRAEAEHARAERLAAQLRALGITPDLYR